MTGKIPWNKRCWDNSSGVVIGTRARQQRNRGSIHGTAENFFLYPASEFHAASLVTDAGRRRGLFPLWWSCRDIKVTSHVHLVFRFRMSSESAKRQLFLGRYLPSYKAS
jgi:hypothetical protein